VICPSFTFVSTANAIIRQGARPVFAEIEKRTLNIDIDDALSRVTKRTKAIIPVHYGGFSCDMERLMREAARRHIHVVEDAAQAIGASYNKKALGTFGDIGCFSFHSTKNITCGEGGAVAVNRGGLSEAVQVCREKGTNRFLFLEGKVAKYSWIDVGSSFVVSDILAAMLLEQLKKLDFITKKRRAIFDIYCERLKDLDAKRYISLPKPNSRSFGNGHIFWMLLNKSISRKHFIERMRERGIECTHHYVPLHSSPFGIGRLGCKKEDLPVTEDVAGRLVRLPLHPYLKSAQAVYVVEQVKKLLLQ
jgi:dTDP-4-amino-4,6-dideoxygalactose transaminase